jgi:ADP-ribosylglycohydrolase
MTGHLTAGQKRTRASAAAAVAQALAHTRPAQPDDTALAQTYPYVTTARARQIRHELEETRNARHRR